MTITTSTEQAVQARTVLQTRDVTISYGSRPRSRT